MNIQTALGMVVCVSDQLVDWLIT